MDTQNCIKVADPDPFAELQGRKVIAGTKQLRKALCARQVNIVFLAENADPTLTEPIEALCLQNRVRCKWVSSMEDLGHACGIDVGAAAAAAVNEK